TVVKIVACVIWLAWLQLAFGVVAEVAAVVRRRDRRAVPTTNPLRHLSASLVASVAMLLSGSGSAGAQPFRPLAAVALVPVAPLAPAARRVAPMPRVAPVAPERTWTVRPRDTLWGIAEQSLGRGIRWAEIRDLNVGREAA